MKFTCTKKTNKKIKPKPVTDKTKRPGFIWRRYLIWCGLHTVCRHIQGCRTVHISYAQLIELNQISKFRMRGGWRKRAPCFACSDSFINFHLSQNALNLFTLRFISNTFFSRWNFQIIFIIFQRFYRFLDQPQISLI